MYYMQLTYPRRTYGSYRGRWEQHCRNQYRLVYCKGNNKQQQRFYAFKIKSLTQKSSQAIHQREKHGHNNYRTEPCEGQTTHMGQDNARQDKDRTINPFAALMASYDVPGKVFPTCVTDVMGRPARKLIWPFMPALKRPHSRKLTFLIRFLSTCGTLFGRNRSSKERVKVIQRIFGRTRAKDAQHLSLPHPKAEVLDGIWKMSTCITTHSGKT